MRIELRLSIDTPARDEDHASALDAQLRRAPTDRVGSLAHGARGFALRAEIPVFLALVFGATLGLGILGHVLVERMTRPSMAAQLMPLVLDTIAALSLARLLLSLDRRVEFVAEQGRVVVRTRWRQRITGEARVDADEVTAVLLVREHGRARVVLVGARNSPLATVHRETAIDPPSLSLWMARAVAVLARAALGHAVHHPRRAGSEKGP